MKMQYRSYSTVDVHGSLERNRQLSSRKVDAIITKKVEKHFCPNGPESNRLRFFVLLSVPIKYLILTPIKSIYARRCQYSMTFTFCFIYTVDLCKGLNV